MMKIIGQNTNTNLYKFIFISSILGLFLLSCTCRKLMIKHLSFFDELTDTYQIFDSARVHPLTVKSIFYVINQSCLECISLNELDNIIKHNSQMQDQLKGSYYEVDIICYLESNQLNEAIKSKSHKLLTLCNDEIVAEYIWRKKKLVASYYYKNGRIKGSELIQLEDINYNK